MYRILLFLNFFLFLWPSAESRAQKLLLVYQKSGYAPPLQLENIQAIQQLAQENKFRLDTAALGPKFQEYYLQKYQGLIFIDPAPELLNPGQRQELERYLQAGGGLLQISPAPPAEVMDWPWYTRLQEAGLKAQYVKSFQVEDKNQLKYWHTAFENGFYSQITLINEKELFKGGDWFADLPNELHYITNHPPVSYKKINQKKNTR